MMFSMLILLLGLLAHPGACCASESLHLQRDLASNIYPFASSCVQADSLASFAVCIAQRNSLDMLLECAKLSEDETWLAEVPTGSFLDAVRTDSESVWDFNTNDGKLRFTPKQLLHAIAESDGCGYLSLGAVFRACPFESLTSFVQCLCCYRVEARELQGLQDRCIHRNSRRWVLPEVLAQESAVSFTCKSLCPLRRQVSYFHSLSPTTPPVRD